MSAAVSSSTSAVRVLAVRMLLLGCGLWGLSFPTAKALERVQAKVLPEAGSWFFTGVTLSARFGISAMVVLVMLLMRRQTLSRFNRRELEQGVGLGLFGTLGLVFQLDGLAHTEASTSAFLTQGSVIFIPVVKAVLDRHLPSRLAMLCCGLALAGVALLSGLDLRQLTLGRGEAETLIAALFFTGQILWLERPRYLENDSLRVSLVMFGLVGVFSLVPSMGTTHTPGQVWQAFVAPGAWVLLSILIVPCTLLAFLWMNRWQRHVPATTAGLIYCLEPVFASLFAFVLPGVFAGMAGIRYENETADFPMIVGGGLILLANVLMLRPVRHLSVPT